MKPEATGRGTRPADESDRPSFELFFELEHERLFGALYVVTGDRQEAEELMQEAFLGLWERWDRLDHVADPTAYLYRTAMNAFRMRYRKTVVAARKLILWQPPRDPFGEIEMRDDLRRALAKLPRRRRAALVLTDLMGYTAAEAGRILGLKPSTVRGAATKARTALRRELGGTTWTS